MQRGRLAKVKKTKILKLSAVIITLLSLFFIAFSIFFFKRFDLWFFIFCIGIGLYVLIKGGLFLSDSSTYFGSLVFFVGLIGLFINIFNLPFGQSYFLFATSLSSICVLILFKEIFHLFLSFIFAYEGVILYVFQANLINLTIFLILNAILFFIFLVVCAIIIVKLFKRG